MAGQPWWGWHRLDDRWAARLVALAGVEPGDLVLDIGAGNGALTAAALAAGAAVVAVELHPERAQVLRRRFASEDVVVAMADATDLRLPRRPFRVVANPPFAATTAVLKRLVAPGSRLRGGALVVPRHDGRRWADGKAPGAGRWRATFAMTVGPTVLPSAFRPPPPRAAAVLVVRRTW